MARHLNLRGIDCEVVLCSDPDEITGDAAEMFRWLQRCDVPISLLSDCDDESLLAIFREAEWLVDALLGTGAVGAPRAPLDRVIQAMNATLATRLAIDLPSGLDCDTGEASADTVFANYTCTFVALKTGLLAESAKEYVGELHCLDIGLPWSLVLQAISSGDDED